MGNIAHFTEKTVLDTDFKVPDIDLEKDDRALVFKGPLTFENDGFLIEAKVDIYVPCTETGGWYTEPQLHTGEASIDFLEVELNGEAVQDGLLEYKLGKLIKSAL